VLDNRGSNGSATLVHFGGDSGDTSIYRPHLNFYDNTVIDVANQTGSNSRWRTIMFLLDTNAQSVDARNNIFYNAAATSGASPTLFEMLATTGVASFGANWVSPGWLPSHDAQPFNGSISGTGNFFVDPSNNPGFVNMSGNDFHLTSSSSAIGKGGP